MHVTPTGQGFLSRWRQHRQVDKAARQEQVRANHAFYQALDTWYVSNQMMKDPVVVSRRIIHNNPSLYKPGKLTYTANLYYYGGIKFQTTLKQLENNRYHLELDGPGKLSATLQVTTMPVRGDKQLTFSDVEKATLQLPTGETTQLDNTQRLPYDERLESINPFITSLAKACIGGDFPATSA